MKKILLLALSLFLPLMVNASSISVSGTTSISPGESKTLSIIVSSSKAIHGGQFKLNLNSDNFEILLNKSSSPYGEIDTENSSIIVWNTKKALSNNGTLAKIVVKAKSGAIVGETAKLTLSNVVLSYKDGENFVDEDVSNYTKTLTVAEPKSDNNYLSKLSISGYDISFSKTKTSYSLNLPAGTTKLSITAKAEDANAKVAITGNTNLKAGKNTIKVTVTAENGAKRVYTITATVAEKASDSTSCNLKSLSVKGYTINFDPNTTEYRITVPYETTKIEISSVLANTDSTKKTEGPSTLSVGENVYTITVTDEDGNKKVYKVIVNREAEKQECEVCETCEVCEEKTDNVWKILAIILVIVTLAETIYMVTMRDKKQI